MPIIGCCQGEKRRATLASDPALRIPAPVHQDHDCDAGEEYDGAQDLPHGEGAEHEANLGVRLAEELRENPECSVQNEKEREENAPSSDAVPDQPKNEKKRHPFEQELIQLRGVSGMGPSSGEDHAPRRIRNAAIELSVNEVAEPAQAQADGRGGYDEIGRCPGVGLELPAAPQARDHAADESAVEGHPALPDCEDVPRPLEVFPEIVEEHVTQPGADDKAENKIRIERREKVRGEPLPENPVILA